MAAYLQVAATWNEGASLDREGKWAPDALIAQAAADDGNVVSLDTLDAAPEASGGERPIRRSAAKPGRLRVWALAASVLLAVAGLSAWFVMQRGSYSTAVGEQRSIALADGSTINLNSRSRMRVRYSDRERVVELLQGQALFQVAKNPSRPFIVKSGDTAVRAVGTQFDVYRKHGATVVTVVEGLVAVLPPRVVREASGADFSVAAGEQLTILSESVTKAGHANVASATAWVRRQLVFESTPLNEVVEEFNRYNERQLVLRDPGLNTFRIDGVFSSTDPSSLIRFLRSRPGVAVSESGSEIDITTR
jgi:transmembrane sensor